MSILKPAEREYVQGVFKFVENEVKISLFTQEHESQASRETRELLEELSSISDKISLRVLLRVRKRLKSSLNLNVMSN